MPGFIDSFLSSLAPHMRSLGIAILVFTALCIFLSSTVAGQKLRNVFGISIASCALVFGLTMFVLYFTGHLKAMPGSYTDSGKLILYGIIWPILEILLGLEVACGKIARPSPENEGKR